MKPYITAGTNTCICEDGQVQTEVAVSKTLMVTTTVHVLASHELNFGLH